MRASALEFRLRMVINTAIILLGFWAPWQEMAGRRLAAGVASAGVEPTGMDELSVRGSGRHRCGFCIAALSALTARVGHGVSRARYRPELLHEGRLGGRRWALSLRAQSTLSRILVHGGRAGIPHAAVGRALHHGADHVFLVRLTLGEEAFLAGAPGRTLPGLPARGSALSAAACAACSPSSGARPHWLRALLAELTPIGIFVALLSSRGPITLRSCFESS